MPECVLFRLYLLLDAWENFDIALDLRSGAISIFPTHFEVKYRRKETHSGIIFYTGISIKSFHKYGSILSIFLTNMRKQWM